MSGGETYQSGELGVVNLEVADDRSLECTAIFTTRLAWHPASYHNNRKDLHNESLLSKQCYDQWSASHIKPQEPKNAYVRPMVPN